MNYGYSIDVQHVDRTTLIKVFTPSSKAVSFVN